MLVVPQQEPENRISKLVAAPLLLSALFFTSSSRGNDSDALPSPATIPPATRLRLPVCNLYDQSKAVAKELLPAVGGVELIKDSTAQNLLQQINSFWSKGKSAPSEAVAQLLKIASEENGTFITSERLRAILDQNPNRDVQLNFLRYSLSSPVHGVSDTTLNRFWNAVDPEIIARALLCKAKEVGRIAPKDFFAPFQKHSSPMVRQACAIAMMAGGHPLPELSPFDLFKCSTQLSIEHHTAALEGRLAMALSRQLYPKNTSDTQDISSPNHAAALLHLLQRIDQAFPGYLETVHGANPEYFNEIARGLSAVIKRERDVLLEQELVTAQGHGIMALHFESQFSPTTHAKILEDLGATEICKIKAGNLPDGSHGVDAKPAIPIPDSQFSREYRAELDSFRSSTPRETYLEELSRRSKDNSRPLLVIHSMHGGPDHSWFYHGAPGKDDSNDLSTPRAISHQDIADTLFHAADLSKGTLNLGHVVVILEACRQYTVAQDALARIEELAHRAGVEIVANPMFVSISQPFMYAGIPVSELIIKPENDEEAKTIPREGLSIAQFLTSVITLDLAAAAKQRKSVRFKDLIQSDQKSAEAYFKELENPKLLLALDPEGAQEVERAKNAGLETIEGISNPAIFGPKPFLMRKELEDIIEKIRETSPDCPESPGKNGPEISTFLELS